VYPSGDKATRAARENSLDRPPDGRKTPSPSWHVRCSPCTSLDNLDGS